MIRPVNLIPHQARLFRSLGDEGRLAVIEALIAADRRVPELMHETQQSQSTVSTHLATLHAAGLVTRRQAGRQVVFGLAHPAVAALLEAGENVVMATSQQSYACSSPCCNPSDS